ncbi:MAG: glucose-6-phosphate isomerase, partial [Myxococcota bacterium]|nr:glucose-6-phosphate isomerase [Myxococcota bacterium]
MTALQRTGWPYYEDQWLGMSLDLRGMGVRDAELDARRALASSALEAMAALEAGALANPTEQRRVGHYWLREPALAPDPAITEAIRAAQALTRQVAEDLAGFETVLHVGIGGSALGPQLLSDALGDEDGGARIRFLDNIDPHGIADVLNDISLASMAVIVVSKSGTTAETMGALGEVEEALEAEGHTLAERTVAITMDG